MGLVFSPLSSFLSTLALVHKTAVFEAELELFIHLDDLRAGQQHRAIAVRRAHNWKGLSKDKLHLSPEGHEMWATELNALLSSIMAVPVAK